MEKIFHYIGKALTFVLMTIIVLFIAYKQFVYIPEPQDGKNNNQENNIDIIDIREHPLYEDASFPGYSQYIDFMRNEGENYPGIYIPIQEHGTELYYIAEYTSRFDGAWYRTINKDDPLLLLEDKDDPESYYIEFDYGIELYVTKIQGSMAHVYYDENLGWVDFDMLAPVRTPLVFIDKDNKYYHTQECIHLDSSYTPLYFMDAYDRLYTPCQFCN